MTGEVHPAADLFPLMGTDELRALADDIREHGLRQPVVLDGEGRVLDGRNRLAACALAEVEPEFVSVNGDDPVAIVVSLNVKRRNLTAGQRAIAAAEAWGLAIEAGQAKPTRGGDPNRKFALSNPAKHFAPMFGCSPRYVEHARELVERAVDLAAEVKSGGLSMPEALTKLGDRDTEAEERAEEAARREAARERMAAEHADLAEAVERSDLSIVDAMAQVAEREETARREADDAAQSRRIFTQNLVAAVDLLQMKPDRESVAIDAARLDPDELPAHWSQERLTRAAEYLSTLNEEVQKDV